MSKHDSFDISVDIKAVTEGLERKQRNMGKAINATVSDFGRRGPGWISQEVRKVYGVDAKTVKSDYKGYEKEGKVKVGGVKIDNVKLKYSGRVLTISHFKMTPKARPSKPYQVKAEIIRGRKRVVNKAFLADPSGPVLAFKRTKAKAGSKGKAIKYPTRYPIKTIKTVSVPQMVESKMVSPELQKRIGVELKKRWDHNVERFDK